MRVSDNLNLSGLRPPSNSHGIYERLPELAAELVRLDVDVFVTYALPGVLAAKQATTTIPIVMTAISEAVRVGIIAGLNRPGGNITGVTYFHPELNVKRLEFLKEALPGSRRIGVLFNPSHPMSPVVLEAMELAAKSLNLELQPFGARKPDEYQNAFSAIAARRVDGIVVLDDAVTVPNAGLIVELATAQRLPSIGFLELAKAGGLMAYAADFVDMWRHAADFVDKILKGASPATLPAEQATKFELVTNLRTAKALGLTIPTALLARADEVIE